MHSLIHSCARSLTPPLIDSPINSLIHRYIQNRTYDLAVKNVLDGAFLGSHCFWSGVSDGRQRNECLTIIEICRNTLNDEGQALRDEMAAVGL